MPLPLSPLLPINIEDPEVKAKVSALLPWFTTGEQKAILDFLKSYHSEDILPVLAEIQAILDAGVPAAVAWGQITGTLAAQLDLQAALDAKQEDLVSGTNIKTINGASILGSGDLVIVGGGSVSADANEGITVTGSSIGTVYNTLIDDAVTSVAVGGAPAQAASAWKTKNIVQVLDTILFPDVLPTYTIPTITCSSSVTGIREIGEVINPVITVVGSKNDAGTFTTIYTVRGVSTINTNNAPTQNAITNIAAQFGYADPNNPNYSYTSAYTDTSFTVPSGSTTWNGRGSYGAGLAKKNNKGVDDVRAAIVRSVDAKQAADAAFNSTTVSITGIHPYFWGVSNTQPTPASIAAAIAAGTTNKVLSVSTGTVSVTYNASSQYVWVAIPASSTVKTTWYNTALNNSTIGPGQFILSPVLQNVNSPEARWSAVSFNVYISGYASTTSGAIEFRN